MKKIEKLFLVFLLGVAFTVLKGCDGLLLTVPPDDVPPEDVLSNIEGLTGLVISSHSRMTADGWYGHRMILGPEVLADNAIKHAVTRGYYGDEAINAPGAHLGLYGTAYNAINEANFVIHSIGELENVSEGVHNLLLGQAYMIRGLAYHDLVKIYGYEPGREVNSWDKGVIVRTEPTRDVTDADDRARATNEEVYDQIVSDLERAIELLDANERNIFYSNISGNNNAVFYANYEAALAIMARVHLYLEDWLSAIEYATLALETTSVSLVHPTEYSGSWNNSPNAHPESLMEIWRASSGQFVSIGQFTHPNGYLDILPSQDVLNLYEQGDIRLELYDEHSDGSPYLKKFTNSYDTYEDHVPIIRYPELLLIRAEAFAEVGNETNAIADLETLRIARGLEPYNNPPSGNNLITEILDERRRELIFEGHRWFDLKRRGMDISKSAGLPTISYTDYRILAPIFSSEVEDFQNIIQNPGY